jgi:RNA polymerase sigma-70 factor (ECF subfamily)
MQAACEGALTAYVARILGDAHEARDVVQDAFLRLLVADPPVEEGRMTAWLYTVARRRAIDVKRKQRAESVGLAGDAAFDPPDPAPGPSRRAAADEDAARAERALAALPPLQAEAVRLKLGHGLSYAEIGGVMGVRASYAGYLICMGLKAVRRALGGEDGASAPGDVAGEVR